MIVANKMDMPQAEKNLEEFKKKIDPKIQIHAISAFTKKGLKDLLYSIADTLDKIPKVTVEIEAKDEKAVYRHKRAEIPFSITRDSDGAYVLSGDQVETLFKMTDFTSNESAQRFARQLRALGVDEALRKRGALDGDTIRLLDFEFEFIE